jgi:GntR family transcriptional regulator / MocR family aminotransferase
MAKRARRVSALDIVLTRGTGVPLTRQLYSVLRHGILAGRVRAGQHLPSSRVLAKSLAVSRNTVLEVYERLAAEGYLIGKTGSGTRVDRPQPQTYLSEVPRLPSRKPKTFRQIVRDSLYPVSAALLRDTEGNSLYLFTS